MFPLLPSFYFFLPLLPYFILPRISSPLLPRSSRPPLTGILVLFGRLFRPLRFRTKIVASRDEFNVLSSGLDNGRPFGIFRYTILCYPTSILLLTIYSVPPPPLYPLLLPPPIPLILFSITLPPPPLLLLLVFRYRSSGRPTIIPYIL